MTVNDLIKELQISDGNARIIVDAQDDDKRKREIAGVSISPANNVPVIIVLNP